MVNTVVSAEEGGAVLMRRLGRVRHSHSGGHETFSADTVTTGTHSNWASRRTEAVNESGKGHVKSEVCLSSVKQRKCESARQRHSQPLARVSVNDAGVDARMCMQRLHRH